MGRTDSRRVPARTRWLLVGLVAGAILLASVLPRSTGAAPPVGPGPANLVGADKWLHGLAYAGLALALLYALSATDRPFPQAVALTLGLAVAFGLGVEIVQAPLPSRQFDTLDAVANAVGASIAATVWMAGRRLLQVA